MPEQAPSTCALVPTESFKMRSRGSPSNTTVLVVALSSQPKHGNQPTKSKSSPARRDQIRLSPCPSTLLLTPLQSRGSHPTDGMPATASLTEPSAPIAGDRIARQQSTAKALRMAKPLCPPHRLAGHGNSAIQVASICHSIPAPRTSITCSYMARGTGQALGDCHRGPQ
ncbi:hypothetical protein J3F84DRAFT_377966 [Trichoderma pleuroticola]